jgi:transposase-like protein
MRARGKLTPEEQLSLALELLRGQRPFHEVCAHYSVSHTTAYKIRNRFLEGGRTALTAAPVRRRERSLETRLRHVENAVFGRRGPGRGNGHATATTDPPDATDGR